MYIVITGGAGFIGSCLLGQFNADGVTDIMIVDEMGYSEKWKNLVNKRFEDYLEKEKFLDSLTAGQLDHKIDTIIHLGACSSTTETDARFLMENNYRYSRVLAEWALRHKKRFIYASSAATYGTGDRGYSDKDDITPTLSPLNMYGFSKQVFDLWVLKNNLQSKFVGLKYFNVYGPNEYHKGDMRSMIHKGYQQIKASGAIRLFKSYKSEYADGEQKRDFIYVKDAVAITRFFFDNPKKTGIFNVGTGEAHSWNELAQALFTAMGIKARIKYFDMPEALREKYQYYTQAEVTKLREAGYTVPFTRFEDAIKDYVGTLETTQYI